MFQDGTMENLIASKIWYTNFVVWNLEFMIYKTYCIFTKYTNKNKQGFEEYQTTKPALGDVEKPNQFQLIKQISFVLKNLAAVICNHDFAGGILQALKACCRDSARRTYPGVPATNI